LLLRGRDYTPFKKEQRKSDSLFTRFLFWPGP
jgi:hypothetical protein